MRKVLTRAPMPAPHAPTPPSKAMQQTARHLAEYLIFRVGGPMFLLDGRLYLPLQSRSIH